MCGLPVCAYMRVGWWVPTRSRRVVLCGMRSVCRVPLCTYWNAAVCRVPLCTYWEAGMCRLPVCTYSGGGRVWAEENLQASGTSHSPAFTGFRST